MKKYKDEPDILRSISQILADTAIVNISSFSLRELIRKLTYLNNPSSDFTNYIECILDSLLKILKENTCREIFVFTGQPQSGVSIVQRTELPSEGYCFFGWIRFERCTLISCSQSDSPMCIYRFAAEKEAEIKLFLSKGHLFYSTISYKNNENALILQLTKNKLSDDVWYFFELYHFNSPASVSFFIDGVEVFKGAYRPYRTAAVYDNNSVGCEVVSKEKVQGDTVLLKENLRGEAGVIHFAAVSPAILDITRSVLTKVHKIINMHDLLPLIAFGENRCPNMPRLQKKMCYYELTRSALLNRIFFVVSPKYARNSTSEPEKVFSWKQGGIIHDFYNHTEEIYKQARIHHNYPGKDVLINIGGIKCLLPIFYELAEMKDQTAETLARRNVMVEKLLEMIKELTTLDREKSAIFYETDDGIMIIWYLLQRLAKKGGLSSAIYEILRQILYILLNFYPNSAEMFIEVIYMNMDIWKYSSKEVQFQIAEKIHQTHLIDSISKQYNIVLVIDCLLKSIEIFTEDDSKNKEIIQRFLRIITSLSKKYISTEILTTIISYANVYFARRLVNYPLHIYYSLAAFIELHTSCKEKVVNIIKEAVKVKRDSKIISTLFTIFDYFVSVKENGFRLAYEGLLAMSDNSGEESADDLNEGVNMPQIFQSNRMEIRSIQENAIAIFQDTRDDDETIDGIIAMSIYWMLSFDWSALCELSKEYTKETKFIQKGNLVGYIIKTFGRIMTPSKSKTQVLFYIFNGVEHRKKEIFGPACYEAFKSLIYELPFHPKEFTNTTVPLLELLKDKPRILSQPLILQELIEYLSLFTIEARKEFFKDFILIYTEPRFLTEVMESEKLIDKIFMLNSYPESNESVTKFQQILLCHIASQLSLSGIFAKTCATLSCPSKDKLSLLDSILDFYLCSETKTVSLLYNTLLQVSYVVEDIVVKDPKCCLDLHDILCKLLYLLTKADLLYVSLPIISLFDRRSVGEVGDWTNSDILRKFFRKPN